jgi:hypothetical protein
MDPRSELPKPHLNGAPQPQPQQPPAQPQQSQHIPGLSDAEISGQAPGTQYAPSDPDSGIQNFAQRVNGKQILIFAVAGMAILAITLIVLVIILLVVQNNRKATPSNVTGNDTTDSTKKVVKSVKLSNKNLELLIYEPVQKGSNTTIDFAILNKCTNCDEAIHASAYELLGYSTATPKNMYLLDDDVGKKYAPLTDEDGKALGTESCTDYLKNNESIECFVSFSKVPSGKSVSLVLGSNAPRIDGISIP